MKVMDNLWTVERLCDPTHFGTAQFREYLKADIQTGVLPKQPVHMNFIRSLLLHIYQMAYIIRTCSLHMTLTAKPRE